MDGDVIIGFMDESSPQTTANTQRLWSFGKPTIYKNTDKINSHRADYTKQIAIDKNINLVFLPKYSPDLNPIEYIWKSIKRVVSRSFVRDIDHMRALIRDSFLENAKKLSFAGYWIERFLGGDDWYNKFSF